MDKSEFRKVMSFTYKAFRQEPNDEEFEAYYVLLKDYDTNVVKKSVHSICKTSKYFPRVSDIIEGMVDVPEERLVAEDILKIAEDSMYSKLDNIDFNHELTKAIVIDIGLSNLGKMSPTDLRNTIHYKYKDIAPAWKQCKMENREFLISNNTLRLKRSGQTRSIKELLERN